MARKKNKQPDTMQMVEQHIIRSSDERFAEIDAAAFASKNLWNYANYAVRQSFIHENHYLSLKELYEAVKGSEAYRALPRKVSNQVLWQLRDAWSSFFEASKAYKDDPTRFLGRPKLPGYKDKTDGRNLLIYENGAVQKRSLKKGLIDVTGLHLAIPTDKEVINQVRIAPRKGRYIVEIIYTVSLPQNEALDPSLVAGIDLGVDNLITLTSNKVGFQPQIINGRHLKSINQGYNKTRAQMQSALPGKRQTSRQLQALTNNRNSRVKDYLHKASRMVIDRLVAEGIGTLVIGYNKGWKQEVNIGRANNQKFVSIPYTQLLEMLVYKAKLAGIKVIQTPESYTSKCSFLDLEPIRKKTRYLGRRVKRGLFSASDGTLINADVNAAYNIIRKVFPKAFTAEGIAGLAVVPVRVNVYLGPSAKKLSGC